MVCDPNISLFRDSKSLSSHLRNHKKAVIHDIVYTCDPCNFEIIIPWLQKTICQLDYCVFFLWEKAAMAYVLWVCHITMCNEKMLMSEGIIYGKTSCTEVFHSLMIYCTSPSRRPLAEVKLCPLHHINGPISFPMILCQSLCRGIWQDCSLMHQSVFSWT